MEHVSVPVVAMVKHPEDREHKFQPPPGTEEGDILPASVLVGLDELDSGARIQALRTYWRPTEDELASLQLGAVIEVTLLTSSLPPHHVEVL